MIALGMLIVFSIVVYETVERRFTKPPPTSGIIVLLLLLIGALAIAAYELAA
jgi:hypothetical protein